jgi:predicted AAA+ superfamily ATPase
MSEFIRKFFYDVLVKGITGKPNLLQVVVGPRQVGKTTLALQVKKHWPGPSFYHSADLPNTPDAEWIMNHWLECRSHSSAANQESLLIFDEVQKIPRWSEVVKKMADEDRIAKRSIRVVLLGSSSLLMQKGLNESLAGRFELHRHHHWTYAECRDYFHLSLPEYLYFGGYPGAIPLRTDENRWAKYVRDSLIETVLGKDVLLMSPVSKPALLRQVFGLCLAHAAEIMSYQKMIGQLHDAGNTTTIASYIRLFADAFLFAQLEKYSGSRIRQRGSMPKIVVLDNALISAVYHSSFHNTFKNKTVWGRMVENAVGSKLNNWLQERGGRLYYWRDRHDEVDYIAEWGRRLLAVEVKSGVPGKVPDGLHQFAKRYPQTDKILISASAPDLAQPGKQIGQTCRQIDLEQFFLDPAAIFK